MKQGEAARMSASPPASAVGVNGSSSIFALWYWWLVTKRSWVIGATEIALVDPEGEVGPELPPRRMNGRPLNYERYEATQCNETVSSIDVAFPYASGDIPANASRSRTLARDRFDSRV